MSNQNIKLFPGSRLFELKATHGMPLEAAIDQIVDSGFAIDWCEFITCARKNKWYDYQIIKLIEQGLAESIIDRTSKAEILKRCKLFILLTTQSK